MQLKRAGGNLAGKKHVKGEYGPARRGPLARYRGPAPAPRPGPHPVPRKPAMTENQSVRTPATQTAPAKRLAACGWCDSTHIADVTCTCKEPCPQGWCPA